MIDFHGDALTAEVFVTGTPGFDRSALDTQTNRQNNTKNTETINTDNTSPKKDEVVKQGKAGTKKDKKVKKEDKGQKSPLTSPSKRTTRRTAKIEASSKENEPKTNTLVSNDDVSTEDTSTSADSESVQVNKKQNSDCSSDFVPSRYPKRKKTNVDTTPADSVKKRRRTPSWKFGANGRPTIVSGQNDSAGSKGKSGKSQRKSSRLAAKETGTKSGKKRGRPRAVPLPDTSDQELDDYDDVAPGSLDLVVKLDKEKQQLHGHEESYNKLPWFCEKILETNPGSVSKLVINENKRFKSLFVSFYASLSGFQNSCRPLLFLESTSLRSKYGEHLFTANAIDGNDGFFPVAFAIVDIEDNDTWRWFLENLKSTILTPHPITFVFDRDKNLKVTILEVFENAYIGYSIYHLLESFKRTVKGPFHGDGKSFLPVHFLTAAHAVRLVGFKKSTEQIKQISSHAYDWVMQIEPQHWTTSSFEGERYNHITDDINVSISKLMEDNRELPVLQKIDALIRLMIDEINDAKLDATMWGTHLTPSKERQLQEENLRSCGLKVLISSDTLFEVREDSTHVVNISSWSCTCLGWKETGLPCRHALAVFALIGKNPYEFCSNYFTVDAYRITYAECIAPVPIEKEEEVEKLEMKSIGGEVEYSVKIEGEEEKGVKMGETEKEEWETVEEGQKSEKVEVEGEKMEIEKGGGENEESLTIGGENEESLKIGGEIEDSLIIGGENEEGLKIGGENDEFVKVGGENEENVNVGGENEEGGKVVGEIEESAKVEGENEEGGKDEGEKGKIITEDEVLVLPPIPVQPADVAKEKMEWEETEVETKRTVTCTKCKQPGHNKKSCNLYQLQQAC
ncbi:hypothetical protein L1887_03056 [Cichorium endivia]|nr:hypothetical protein L1887_03056 [Cichorium endivia]